MNSKIMKFILIVFLIIFTITVIILNSTPIVLKKNISKAEKMEIYVLDNNEFILQTKVVNKKIIDELIGIFTTIEYTNQPKTLPLPKYKLVFYNKKGKKITEIKCLPGIVISDLKNDVTLSKDKYNSLEKIINSIIEEWVR